MGVGDLASWRIRDGGMAKSLLYSCISQGFEDKRGGYTYRMAIPEQACQNAVDFQHEIQRVGSCWKYTHTRGTPCEIAIEVVFVPANRLVVRPSQPCCEVVHRQMMLRSCWCFREDEACKPSSRLRRSTSDVVRIGERIAGPIVVQSEPTWCPLPNQGSIGILYALYLGSKSGHIFLPGFFDPIPRAIRHPGCLWKCCLMSDHLVFEHDQGSNTDQRQPKIPTRCLY
jgi:hypothetical protein